MSSEFVLTQGAGQKLEFAVKRNGGTITDIEWLSAGENFATVMSIARGHAKVEIVAHVINLDANPFVPADWKVKEHKKAGQLEWSPEKVKLYLSKNQQGGCIEGHKLRKELEDKPVLNANVLDYLLGHPELIPEEWKGKYVSFWGTIYRNSGRQRYVRFLCWVKGRWNWSYLWLDDNFASYCPAALLASEN